MSRIKQYTVGGLTYRIYFVDQQNSEALIPSSSAFAVALDEQAALFELVVDDCFRPASVGQEIGFFDSDSAYYRFLRTDNNNYQIVISDTAHNKCALMQTNSTFSYGNISLSGHQKMRQFGLNNALMLMYAFAAADKGTLLMHSSVVCNNKNAFLFLGESGTGKSTHSQLWLKYIEGSELINDDNPIVRIVQDGIHVYGSPWSGKTPCYRNIQATVGAFIQLQQAAHNHIHKQNTIDAFTSLLTSSSKIKWDARIYCGVCNTIQHIMKYVPNFVLQCRPDKEAAILCHATVAKYN